MSMNVYRSKGMDTITLEVLPCLPTTDEQPWLTLRQNNEIIILDMNQCQLLGMDLFQIYRYYLENRNWELSI